jgi:hypothetical protein
VAPLATGFRVEKVVGENLGVALRKAELREPLLHGEPRRERAAA